MTFRFLLSVIATAAGLLIFDVATAQNPQEKEIRKVLVKDPEAALKILDEIEDSKPPVMEQHKIDMMRAMVYNELRMFSLKEIYINKVLENNSASLTTSEKLQAMAMLLSSDSYYGKIDKSAELAQEALLLARESGNKAAELHILQSVAMINFKAADKKKGYEYLKDIIDNSDSKQIRVLAGVSSAYGVLINELMNDDRLDEASRQCSKRLEVIEKIDRIGGAPAGFTDQQRAYTYAKLAQIEELSGHRKKAGEIFKSFLATDYGKTDYGKVFITSYLLESRQFKTVLEYLTPLYDIMQQGDTINSDYHDLLDCTGRAYYETGNSSKAYNLTRRAAVINDSLHVRERKSRAIELATTFKLKDKELALAKSETEIQKKKMLMLMALGVALIILIGLLIVLRQYHITLQRNKIAAKQIDELMAQKEKFYRFQSLTSNADDSSDYAEFASMERKIVENSLFLKRNFNRDSIADECGIPRNRVTMLIQRYADASPGDYINKLKVQYSVKLIKEHKEWTIDAIAEAAGYSNRSTYYQNFYKVFAITPAQYRRQCESGEDSTQNQ